MHWLYNTFSSSSSSPSQSSAAVDNCINNRSNIRMCDAVNKFSPRRIIRSHYHKRHGTTRSTTHQEHVNDNDIVQAPSRSISTPHILPLPKLSTLFKHESRHEANDIHMYRMHILPSPEDATLESFENKGNLNASHKNSRRPPCIGSLDSSRNKENKQLHIFQKWPQGSTFTPSPEDGHKQNAETASAPTTPVSNRALSPPTNKINMYSFNNNLSLESPMNRHDSNAQATVATVHPLPLPPGVHGLPSSSSPQTIYRPDLVPKMPRQSCWQKGKLIGRGTFGSVYVGADGETGALCAMKEVEILPDDAKSAESIKQLEQEIDVLRKLKHPNIVQYYGSEIVEDRFYIYLEYVHPGSINKYVRDHCGGMTESIVRNFTRHIVSGLAYLHSTKTIHRDIKGANLLVDANGVVKLADFGMAKNLDGQVNLSLKGSPYWLAPELLHVEPKKDGCPDLALAVDIWSLGCTVIEMMNGKPPWNEYEGPAAMFKVMKETPPIPEAMSPDGKDFLRCCFVRNPAERPTANVLLEHKFLMVQNRREHSR